MKDILERMIRVADVLDQKGFEKQAAVLDKIMDKVAQKIEVLKPGRAYPSDKPFRYMIRRPKSVLRDELEEIDEPTDEERERWLEEEESKGIPRIPRSALPEEMKEDVEI